MRPPPPPEFRTDRRLVASLVAGLFIIRGTDHVLAALALLALTLAVIWVRA